MVSRARIQGGREGGMKGGRERRGIEAIDASCSAVTVSLQVLTPFSPYISLFPPPKHQSHHLISSTPVALPPVLLLLLLLPPFFASPLPLPTCCCCFFLPLSSKPPRVWGLPCLYIMNKSKEGRTRRRMRCGGVVPCCCCLLCVSCILHVHHHDLSCRFLRRRAGCDASLRLCLCLCACGGVRKTYTKGYMLN